MFSKNVLINKKSLAKNSLGTNKLIRGTTHIPVIAALYKLKQTLTDLTRQHVSYYYNFTRTASVGNSKYYLNLRKFSADDFLSLKENNTLLNTFIAFSLYNFIYAILYFSHCPKKSQLI